MAIVDRGAPEVSTGAAGQPLSQETPPSSAVLPSPTGALPSEVKDGYLTATALDPLTGEQYPYQVKPAQFSNPSPSMSSGTAELPSPVKGMRPLEPKTEKV